MSTTPIARAAAAIAVAAVATTVAFAAPASAASPRYAYGGSGYGSTAVLGNDLSERTAYAPMCTTAKSFTGNNADVTEDLGAAGTVGPVTTKVRTRKINGVKTSQAITTVQPTSLLGGLIRFNSVTTQATAARHGSGYRTASSVTFSELVINGVPQDARPAPSTAVNIPGVGNVVLNKRSKINALGDHRIAVTALTVYVVAGNPLSVGQGTIAVGAASASVHNPVRNRGYGSSYGSHVRIPGALPTNPNAGVYLPCGGSSGKTASASLASASSPDAITTGVTHSKGATTETSKKTVSRTQSEVAKINLLNGLITAKHATGRATATRTGQNLKTSSAGTTVSELTIKGKLIRFRNKENVKREIAGVGTLWLHKTTRTGTGIQVVALQLQLTTAQGTLPVGTVINIGSATAGVSYR